MLEEGDMKLTDIALQLGYSELAIFSRNFKQWFGLPATEFKEKLKEHSE